MCMHLPWIQIWNRKDPKLFTVSEVSDPDPKLKVKINKKPKQKKD
jgi:hypothetical protein